MKKRQLLPGIESQKIVSQIVRYFEDIHGYFARPKKKGNYPGLIMIHEYWGLNEHIKEMADLFAKNGFAVLAVDLFHGQVTKDPQRAIKFVKTLDQDDAMKNMLAALAFLKIEVGSEKVASIGWCFGGGQSMRLALSGEKFAGTIIYYGNLETNKDILKKITWPVLGVFGELDNLVPIPEVKEFEATLKSLHIENEIYIYPKVGHAFANPSNPLYSAEYAYDALEKTLAFLNRNLKHYRRIKVEVKQ